VIVVDTSVWIDYFRNAPTWQVAHFDRLLAADEAIGLTDLVFTEVLLGLRDERTVRTIEDLLLAHDVLHLRDLDDHRRAANLYRSCRQKGVTIRSTIDCLIASVCIREEAPLLHADVDFDRLARHSALLTVPPPGR
jgi:predicted nucleic acid-binding protein